MNKILILSLILLYLSCSYSPEVSYFPDRPNRIYAIKPTILQSIMKTNLPKPPLNLKVESAQKGQIVTSFEEHPGDFHGIFWWKKQWHERSRYFILISTDWDQKCALTIKSETEQRPNENYPWEEKIDSDAADDKILQILQVVDSQLKRYE